MFYKTAFLKNFVIFTGKHWCWGLFFIKVVGVQASNCIKKGLQHIFSGEYRENNKNFYSEELEQVEAERCSVRKGVLSNFANSQEKPVPGSLFK